jgi:hypothetical protein
MGWKAFTCLLILLLAAAAVDNVRATPAVQPSDPAFVAANDEYLPAARPQPVKRRGGEVLPVPGGPAARTASVATITPHPSGAAQPESAAIPGCDLLYVFMSLQR